MLLTSVILVLREVLEAAMLISVLLALSINWKQGFTWLWWSLIAGAVGAVLFASFLDVITDAVDGAGQEVANASLQLLMYCLSLLIVALIPTPGSNSRVISFLMASAVACAMIREGSEILVYITGFASAEEHRTAVYAGSAIGAGIGVSLGVLLFAALRAMEYGRAQLTSVVLICLMGTGTLMQATMLLEQVDWLPAGKALWDSSGIISEQSIAGELMYAVFGYEATPSVTQVGLYVVCMASIIAAYLVGARLRSGSNEV